MEDGTGEYFGLQPWKENVQNVQMLFFISSGECAYPDLS